MDTPKLENMKGRRDRVSRSLCHAKALDILKQAHLLSRNDSFFLLPVKSPYLENWLSQVMQQIALYETNRT